MIQLLFIWEIIFGLLYAAYLDYEEVTHKHSVLHEEIPFEPVINLDKENGRSIRLRNINCDDFPRYALNCTRHAALIYNSSRKIPPMPSRINDCAMKHMVNCAVDWNSDCKGVTESHYNEESVQGHMHVVNNVCEDEWFLIRYDDLNACIEKRADAWENCYSTFKKVVDEQKNLTLEWTHYETHFRLCCARAQFRRCTLDSLFKENINCSREQAVTLQKYSVIVSEGDVYQDCEYNMMYPNCPGGDPRPPEKLLVKLLNDGVASTINNCLSKLIMCVTLLASMTF